MGRRLCPCSGASLLCTPTRQSTRSAMRASQIITARCQQRFLHRSYRNPFLPLHQPQHQHQHQHRHRNQKQHRLQSKRHQSPLRLHPLRHQRLHPPWKAQNRQPSARQHTVELIPIRCSSEASATGRTQRHMPQGFQRRDLSPSFSRTRCTKYAWQKGSRAPMRQNRQHGACPSAPLPYPSGKQMIAAATGPSR